MGSCVSIHRDPESAMKLRFSVGSKHEKLLIPSPVKEKSDEVNGGDRTVADLAVKSRWSPPRFPNAGSKDEAFFDSQPWLDSDCESDFLSVNGDFTPSRGSTPVHHKFSSTNPPAMKTPDDTEETFGSVDQHSPPDNKKKRLSDLFKESLRTTQYVVVEENAAKDEVVANNNGMLKTEEESVKSAQCCLPSLRSSRSFSERKKKTSPSAER